jgi:hypothetical protein
MFRVKNDIGLLLSLASVVIAHQLKQSARKAENLSGALGSVVPAKR